jgi:dynein heavy chain 2, cytosolic
LKHDKPELEVRRGDLLREEEKMRTELEKLQENLLAELSSAQGDLLQNKVRIIISQFVISGFNWFMEFQELLSSLNETKASSIAIAESLGESRNLKESLQAERELYRPLSEFASRLFFAIENLATVNVIYSFSVASFMQLFLLALEQTDVSTHMYQWVNHFFSSIDWRTNWITDG